MAKSPKRQEAVREPRQVRSQQRVEHILKSCEALILEKGCAALKMNDIAATAEISVASIYQYFPNKQAILAALAGHYLDIFRVHAVSVLSDTPDDIDELWNTAMQLHVENYRLHRENPVIRDIWMGAATDKALQDILEQDRLQGLEIFYEASSHLFKPSQREKVKKMLALFIDFGQTAITRSVTMSEEEGEQYIELTRELLSSCWAGSVRPLARAAKKRN